MRRLAQRQAAPLLERSGAKYLCDGNSQTQGINGPTSAYPYRLGLLLGAPVANFGVGGQTTLQMRSDAATQVHGAFQLGLNVLIASEIHNDLAVRARSTNLLSIARTCADTLWQYLDEARNAAAAKPGVQLKVITWNCLPIGTTVNAIGVASMRGLLSEANDIVRTEWRRHADSYFDVTSDARLVNPLDPTYYVDTVHLKPAGEVIHAEMAYQAVVNLRKTA